MTSIAPGAERRKIVVGVDTHEYAHVAVAIDELGVRLSEYHASANREGDARLEAWAASIGRVTAWGVEGTGSYDVGLASYLRRNGHRLVKVNRGDRRTRRTRPPRPRRPHGRRVNQSLTRGATTPSSSCSWDRCKSSCSTGSADQHLAAA